MFRLPLRSTRSIPPVPFLSRSAPRYRPSPRAVGTQVRRSSEWAAAKSKVDAAVEEWRKAYGDRKTLLIVYHSRTGGAAQMAREVLRGALEGLERDEDVPELQAEWDTAEFRDPSVSSRPNSDSATNPSDKPDISISSSSEHPSDSSSGPEISGQRGERRETQSSKSQPTGRREDTEEEDPGEHVHIRVLPAPLAGPVDLITASGYIFVCPENLAAMSGPMKDFFDRCFYPVLNRLNGRPYQSLICAGSDGAGAAKQLERIATGWRLKRAEETHIANVKAQSEERVYAIKDITEEDKEKCREAGMRLAVGLSVGMF